MAKVVWNRVPLKDDFDDTIRDEFIDGRTRDGQWAIMTPASHKAFGVGIGLGMGQRYVKQPDGRFIKVP